jgi:hypothetical protein
MERGKLAKLRKGDPRKVIVAVVVRERTSVTKRWLAERLALGHTRAVSRLIVEFRRDKKNVAKIKAMNKMLI